MDPIDQLLQQINGQPLEAPPPEVVSKSPAQPIQPSPDDSKADVVTDIDGLLAQVEKQPGKPVPSRLGGSSQPPEVQSMDRLLSQFQEANSQGSSPTSYSYDWGSASAEIESKPLAEEMVQQILGESKSLTRSPEASLLNEIKTHYQQLAEAEEQERQQHLQAEKLRQEALRQQQQAALSAKANAWLKGLDPLSGEGLWFEQFASRYPSKLEAAIDYLVALSSETTGGE